MTEKGRKAYGGEPRNVLVFGLRETRATQVQRKWAARNAQLANKYSIFVEIKWAYRVRSRQI